MNLQLLIIVAVSAAAFAMVPRDRRVVPETDEFPTTSQETPPSTTKREICARQTPCGWQMYKPKFKIVEFNYTNTYCICGPGTVCTWTEDDTTAYAYIFRCRPPTEDSEILS